MTHVKLFAFTLFDDFVQFDDAYFKDFSANHGTVWDF